MRSYISHYNDGQLLGIATSDEIEANILCTKTLTSLSIIRLILATKKKETELAVLRHLFSGFLHISGVHEFVVSQVICV